MGQKPTGNENRKEATAISPDRRNATGRVNRPRSSKVPPNVPRIAASQNSDRNGAVAPLGGMPAGKAKSFIVPASTNMIAARIRRTLCKCGAHDDHFAAMFGAFIPRLTPYYD